MGHVRSLHQLSALLVAKVSFESDGALEGVAAAIPAMVVRHCYLDVGKRDFPPSRLQPYRHRRARGERCAQQLVGVRPRRRAAPAVGPPIENTDAAARPLSVPAPSRSPATTACGWGAPSIEFVIVLSFHLMS